jgi:hypothetical protein
MLQLLFEAIQLSPQQLVLLLRELELLADELQISACSLFFRYLWRGLNSISKGGNVRHTDAQNTSRASASFLV